MNLQVGPFTPGNFLQMRGDMVARWDELKWGCCSAKKKFYLNPNPKKLCGGSKF